MHIDIKSILDDEEQKFLDKIQTKYQDHISKIYEDNIDKLNTDINKNNSSEPYNVAEPSRHITDYQREILIRTLAEISTIDDNGRLKDIDVCFENLYHIPVPPDTDYRPLLDQFLSVFEKDIGQCAKKITESNQ
jgi:hypothetical protein